jgi:hypothetical protein
MYKNLKIYFVKKGCIFSINMEGAMHGFPVLIFTKTRVVSPSLSSTRSVLNILYKNLILVLGISGMIV